LYIWKNPNAPWLTQGAIGFLESYLSPNDIGFEWGTGRSTIWLGSRVGKLYGVEHNTEWFERIKEKIGEAPHIKLYYRPLFTESEASYVEVIKEACNDESLDFCLIDGRARDLCASAAVPKIKPGGLLIIDNAERYFPTDGRIGKKRPDYQNERWEHLHKVILKDWRSFWFSNGIWTTSIFIKPCI
jgi:predicted O-methyltransferase YrrM